MKKIINKAKTDSEESTFVSWKSTTLKEMTNVRLAQGRQLFSSAGHVEPLFSLAGKIWIKINISKLDNWPWRNVYYLV